MAFRRLFLLVLISSVVVSGGTIRGVGDHEIEKPVERIRTETRDLGKKKKEKTSKTKKSTAAEAEVAVIDEMSETFEEPSTTSTTSTTTTTTTTSTTSNTTETINGSKIGDKGSDFGAIPMFGSETAVLVDCTTLDKDEGGIPLLFGTRPELETRDWVCLPCNLGFGSGTLRGWIQGMIDDGTISTICSCTESTCEGSTIDFGSAGGGSTIAFGLGDGFGDGGGVRP